MRRTQQHANSEDIWIAKLLWHGVEALLARQVGRALANETTGVKIEKTIFDAAVINVLVEKEPAAPHYKASCPHG